MGLAASGESVVREFIRSPQAAGRGTVRKRNLVGLAASGQSVVREFLKTNAGSRLTPCLIFIAFLLIALALQWRAGAYRSEFWGFDEAAHFVTGVMLHDYLVAGFPGAPMHFARDFYAHYPKVALGHWPPVFYLVQAAWTLLFSVSRPSLLLLQAVTATLVAFLLWFQWRTAWGGTTAFLAGTSFLLLPVVQVQTDAVMAEMLLCLFLFLAALAYESYLDTGGWRPAIAFSVWAAAAILTKANGWCLVLVPPIALLLSRKFHLLRRVTFWFPALAVTVLCLPWYLLTFAVARDGWRGSTQKTFLEKVAFFNLQAQLAVAGPVLLTLAIIAVACYVVRPAIRGAVSSRWAVLFALWVAVFGFHTLLVPVREVRHQMLAAPAVVSFAWGAVTWGAVTFGLFRRAWPPLQRALLAAGIMAAFILITVRIPDKPIYGARDVIALLERESGLRGTILVSSRLAGEGAIVAEAALQEQHPAPYILRATKLFLHSDWGGWHARPLVTTPGEILAALDRHQVDFVVVDLHPGDKFAQAPQQDLLIRAIEQYPARFAPLRAASTSPSYFAVYRFVRPPLRPS